MTAPAHDRTGLVGELADLLVAKEAEQHRAGWDNTPATLYWVGRDPAAGGTLTPAPCRLGVTTGRHPREELGVLAWAMENDAGDVLYRYMSTALPPVAYMLVMETWFRVFHGSSDEAEAEFANTSLADVPGSIEMRQGLAVMGKHRLMLNRTRGEAPEWVDLPEEAELGGAMFSALVRLQAATRARRALR